MNFSNKLEELQENMLEKEKVIAKLEGHKKIL